MNHLKIQIVDRPEDAPNYRANTLDVRGASLTSALIVRRGTVEGNPTVDLVFKDLDGNEYVAMTTGGLILGLAAALRGAMGQ